MTIISLENSRIFGSTFTLNCSSTGSPATAVTWTMDGETLSNNITYQMIQMLRDATTATYDNLLTVNVQPQDGIGTYTCSVENSISEPAQQTLTLEGKWGLNGTVTSLARYQFLHTNGISMCSTSGVITQALLECRFCHYWWLYSFSMFQISIHYMYFSMVRYRL